MLEWRSKSLTDHLLLGPGPERDDDEPRPQVGYVERHLPDPVWCQDSQEPLQECRSTLVSLRLIRLLQLD
jgi:hypothetical protein